MTEVKSVSFCKLQEYGVLGPLLRAVGIQSLHIDGRKLDSVKAALLPLILFITFMEAFLDATKEQMDSG